MHKCTCTNRNVHTHTCIHTIRQWLPKEKIERLGASPEQDSIKIAMSGHSKRSVMQAFQRAKQYQRRVESKAYPHIVENDSETDDSDS